MTDIHEEGRQAPARACSQVVSPLPSATAGAWRVRGNGFDKDRLASRRSPAIRSSLPCLRAPLADRGRTLRQMVALYAVEAEINGLSVSRR